MDDLAFALFNRLDHLVEAVGEPPDFVIGLDCQCNRAPFAKLTGRFVQFLKRIGDGLRHAPAQDQGQHDAAQRQSDQQSLQAGILRQRAAQGVTQQQLRREALLQGGQIRDVVEIRLVTAMLEHFANRRGFQPPWPGRGPHHIGFQFNCCKVDQLVELGPVQFLRNHQPTDEVGRFDGRDCRQCKVVPAFDHAARFTRIQSGPQAFRILHIHVGSRDNLTIKRQNECLIGFDPCGEALERAGDGRTVPGRDRLTEPEVIGDNVRLVGHLARPLAEDFVEHTRIGLQIARGSILGKARKTAAGDHHNGCQHCREQPRIKRGDTQAE